MHSYDTRRNTRSSDEEWDNLCRARALTTEYTPWKTVGEHQVYVGYVTKSETKDYSISKLGQVVGCNWSGGGRSDVSMLSLVEISFRWMLGIDILQQQLVSEICFLMIHPCYM